MDDTRSRSMVAYITPLASDPVGAVWDAASIVGAIGLYDNDRFAIQESIVEETCGVRANSAGRMFAGAYYWETNPVDDAVLSGCFSGIVEAGHPLTSTSTSSSGLKHGPRAALIDQFDGRCYWNGATAASLGALTTGDRLRHWLDLDAQTYKVALNGGAWETVAATGLLTQGGWYPALITDQGGTGDRIYTGGTLGDTLLYTPPAGAKLLQGQAWTARYFYASSGPMPEGVTAGTNIEIRSGRIASDRDVEIDRRVSCWPWGGQTQSSRGQIVLVNNDGALDHWRNYQWRKASITLRRGYAGDNYAAHTVWSKGYVDRVEFVDNRVIVVIADPLSEVDSALQRRLYPNDFANLSMSGRPKPIAIGRPKYCEGVRVTTDGLSADARAYEYTDGYRDHAATQALIEISAAYDRGDIFTPVTDWAYWPSGSDRRGLKLVNVPDGKVTATLVGSGTPSCWEKIKDVAYIIWSRTAGYWDSTLSLTSLTALETKANWTFAAYITQPITGLQALRELMDSVCGWLAPNRAGAVIAGRLEEPSSTAVLTLSELNVLATPKVTPDLARSLTTSMSGVRNNSIHSDAEIAGAVPTDLREELKREWGVTHTYVAGQLHADYAHADSAPARGSWHATGSGVWQEITRVCALYRQQRNFYELTAVMDADVGDTLEPGATVRLVSDRYGLDTGKNLLVVGVRSRFWSSRIELVLWG